jgi:hypothetical protein
MMISKLFPWQFLCWSNLKTDIPSHWFRTDNENHDPKYAWGFVEVYKSNSIDQKWRIYWKNKKYLDLYAQTPHDASANIEEIKQHIDQFLIRVEKILPFL